MIRREIKPEAVELPRKKDEGSKPLHKRDEFRTREELVEKRVIKVQTFSLQTVSVQIQRHYATSVVI